MKAASLRFWNLILSLLVLAAAIFVYTLLVQPAYQEVNQLRGDLATKASLVEEQKIIVDKVKALLDQYQTLSRPKETIALALPTREEYPTLINQLSGLIRVQGLILESVSLNLLPAQGIPAPGGKVPVLSTVQLNLAVKGSYQAFKNFLQTLENNIRIMDLVSMSITPAPADNYSYNLVVNAYYQSL